MKQVEVYDLYELKEKNPRAYEEVLERWANLDHETPWADETIASLKAVIEACGGMLKEWQISPYDQAHNYIKVKIDDEGKDTDWYKDNVLAKYGYIKNGRPHFPGLCKLTGYHTDDAYLESVYNALNSVPFKEALEALDREAALAMEDDLTQQQSEESMLANWEDKSFTVDGVMVD